MLRWRVEPKAVKIVLLGLTGSFTLDVGRAIPMAAAAAVGLFLYRAGRRLGPAEGVLQCVLFLFPFDPLRIASHFVGANLSFG